MTSQNVLELEVYYLVRRINDLAYSCNDPKTMHLFVNASDGEYYHEIAAGIETLQKLMKEAKAYKDDSFGSNPDAN